MPDQATIKRARRDARQGKSASTQAGEFVRDEIRKIRRGQHGARNARQAIAIGLSEARRSGVKLPAPAKGKASAKTRRKARQDVAAGSSSRRRPASRRRAAASLRALRREPRAAASKRALSRQARQAAARRGPADRSRAARKTAQTRRHRAAAQR